MGSIRASDSHPHLTPTRKEQNTMARKSLKSPEERIAEAQALIARLEAEAAQAAL